jgi:flagellar hook-length control protein FliK
VHLQANTRSAVIQLSPPELGMLMIQIRMEEDKLRAVVRAERPEALEALNRHLPELRATLQQQGLQANDIHLELGLGSREQAREEALLQAQSQGSRRDARSGSASTQSALLARILSPRIGGVDLYA